MNNEFITHVLSITSLLRTLVIKCEAVGVRDNIILAEAGYPVSENKREWRYYMNMAGEYHPTDTPMYVSSLDDESTILFNKANLEEHITTLKGYQPGEYWYRRLTDEYPHQIDLINGILDPIDIDFAIEAEDYKILRFNKNLIQDNEDQLINQTQVWVNAFANKALKYNDYIKTDKLMLPTMIGALYGLLVPLIYIIRLEASGKRYVHDYFIWAKLNSFGDFNRYKPFLNTQQKQWLYRNIEWISNNTGQQFTMDKMIDNLLTPSQIPLSHYQVIQNTKNLLDENIPESQFKRLPLNMKDRYNEDLVFLTAQQLLNKELPLARDNAKEEDFLLEDMKQKLNYSTYSSMSSKVLESSMEDYTNRHADTLMKTLFHEWIYLTKHDHYKAVIDVNNPVTGEVLRFNTRDALILWQYLIMRSKGILREYIQPFYYQHVMRIKLLPVETFQAAGGKEFLDPVLVRDIRKQWMPSPRIISPEHFFDFCFDVYRTKWRTTKMYSKFMDIYRSARAKECVNRLYERGEVCLHDSNIQTYKQWFEAKELNFDRFTQEDCVILAWDIFQKGTAWNTRANLSVRQIQRYLIDLMTELGSYTVQYITDIDDGNRTIENNLPLSLGYSPLTKMTNKVDGVQTPQLPIELHLLTHAKIYSDIKAPISPDIIRRSGKTTGVIRSDPFTSAKFYENPANKKGNTVRAECGFHLKEWSK